MGARARVAQRARVSSSLEPLRLPIPGQDAASARQAASPQDAALPPCAAWWVGAASWRFYTIQYARLCAGRPPRQPVVCGGRRRRVSAARADACRGYGPVAAQRIAWRRAHTVPAGRRRGPAESPRRPGRQRPWSRRPLVKVRPARRPGIRTLSRRWLRRQLCLGRPACCCAPCKRRQTHRDASPSPIRFTSRRISPAH